MRKLLLTGAAFGCLLMTANIARADGPLYYFSGSGGSGHLNTSASAEPWLYTTKTTTGAALPNNDVGWGSPGVSQGVTAYSRSQSATDFEITFASPLDPSQFANGQGCGGSSPGQDVFCDGNTQWFSSEIGTNSLEFTAPAGTQLNTGDQYFVNAFLSPGNGVSGGEFSGSWSVPEPASMTLFGAGLAGLGWIRRRKARK